MRQKNCRCGRPLAAMIDDGLRGREPHVQAELQAIHRYVIDTPALKTVTEEIRAVVETVWPELISKLPPKP